MGLFNRNNGANGNGGNNFMESIQRSMDTNTLIEIDPCTNFNTNSVITVAPNAQAIFIKNGEFYGVLPAGRHQVKTENYPLLSNIRNKLSGGASTFTCQVYHVNLSDKLVRWGTPAPIQIQDFHLGGGEGGVPTDIRGAASLRIRVNVLKNENAAFQTFMRLMGNKSTYTVADLEEMFADEITTKISSTIGRELEQRSKHQSINGISSEVEQFASVLKPALNEMLADYGLEVVNFSFRSLSIDNSETRQKYIDRLTAASHVNSAAYNMAVQQELLKDIAANPGAGGVASAGAGLGMGMAAGSAFAQMATTAFAQPQQPQAMQQPMGYGGQNRFGMNSGQQQMQQQAMPDPMESLSKMKQLLDAGLISQQIYDAKVAEIMSRL